MNDREESIALAAIRTYQAKGVRRTTMSDIAKEAGVTRQTVYNCFANTDAVLRGAIRLFIGDLWARITEAWATCETLEQKMDILLQHFAVEPWDFLNSSAEAAQLEGGYNDAGRAEIAAARLGFRGDIAALFQPWRHRLTRQGTSPLAVADFISAAIEGLKYNNKTRQDMLVAVATLKAAVLALTDEPVGGGD